ncbi:MAG: DUF3240 family protein [Mariprofundaceae bacterium]|nr:DUF3240 family protein [Mariprofundaceae bacterium]
MKNLTMIAHTDAQQYLAQHLKKMKQIQGFSFSHVEGHGLGYEKDDFLSARDEVLASSPRLRVDIILSDKDVEMVLDRLQHEDNHAKLQGVFYWLTAVERRGHFS